MRYTIGSSINEVSDGDFFSEAMSTEYSRGECFIAFYSDAAETLATPTGGTLEFQIDPVGDGQWHSHSSGAIDASTVSAGTALYIPVAFDTCVTRTKLTLTGVTGVTHFKSFHWRS